MRCYFVPSELIPSSTTNDGRAGGRARPRRLGKHRDAIVVEHVRRIEGGYPEVGVKGEHTYRSFVAASPSFTHSSSHCSLSRLLTGVRVRFAHAVEMLGGAAMNAATSLLPTLPRLPTRVARRAPDLAGAPGCAVGAGTEP